MIKIKIHNGIISRFNNEGELHSDWWVPTVVYPDGTIVYFNNGDRYAMTSPCKTKYFICYYINQQVCQEELGTRYSAPHRTHLLALETNPNKIKGL